MNTSESAKPEDLITRARRGDTSALGCLLEISRNYLKLMARLQLDKRLQAKVDPSDLVQESFLKAHRDFHTFRGTTERELLAWLRQILVHNLADRVRRYYGAQKRDVSLERSVHDELEQSSLALSQAFTDGASTPSKRAQERELSTMLADALEALPEHYREVLLLRHLEQHSFPEIAKRMNRSVDSVEKIWVRALSALKKALGAEP